MFIFRLVNDFNYNACNPLNAYESSLTHQMLRKNIVRNRRKRLNGMIPVVFLSAVNETQKQMYPLLHNNKMEVWLH